MRYLINLTPAILGVMVVLQAGINKRIGDRIGLPTAVLFNSMVMCSCALVLFGAIARTSLQTGGLKQFSWWFFLPGLMGLCLVFGGAWSVKRFGAAHTFLVLVSAQLLVSLLWDYWMDGIYPSGNKIVGAALAWVGALLLVRS